MGVNIKELLSKQYDLLGHKDGEVTEIRTLPSCESSFFICKEDFIEGAEKLIKTSKEGIYVGVNPRKTAQAGKVDTISRLTCLVLDIDPVRPKDSGSTEDQHKAAIGLANRISNDLKQGLVVSSGSGAHLYLPISPIEITNGVVLSDSLNLYCKAIREKYSTEEIRIDATFDLPRIVRLFGSNNSRSNRICGPIDPSIVVSRAAYSFAQEPKRASKPVVGADEVTQRFFRLVKQNKRLKDIADGSIAFESKSEADAAFITILSNAQFSAKEIEQLLQYNVTGQSKQGKDIEKDILRVMAKYVESRDVRSFSLANNHSSYFSTLSSRRMGIRTGFKHFDEMISGLKEGKLYIFGARPTTGKTTFMTQVLTNIAEQGIPCLFFPTEVGAEPIIDKIISRKCGIPLKKFQNGAFSESEINQIQGTKDYIASLPITIHEDFGLNIENFEQEVDKYAPKVVCLDYFQALKWDDAASVGEKENAVRRIKKITKDRNIITICLSQLNRNSTGKANMAELKGTGALEEFADVIMQIYKSETVSFPLDINFVVTKSKYSATGDITMKFDNTRCDFTENSDQRS